MRIELILTGSKPDAKSGFLRNPIAPLTGFGVPLRYAPITTGGRFELPDLLRSPAFQTSGFVPNPCRTSCGGLEGCIRPLCYPAIRQRVDSNHRNSFPFNSLAGSRNRPTLPRCHTKPAKRVRQGFSSEIPINICDRTRTCSPPNPRSGCDKDSAGIPKNGLEVRCILPLCYADIASPERLERPILSS